jgi:hypothetical protein
MTEATPTIETPTRRKFPHWIVWPSIAVLLVVLNALLFWILTRGSSQKGRPLDLAPSYNGLTTECTNVRNDSGNPDNLEEFPLGENEFAGIRFAVNGIVLLNGRLPDRVDGLPLNKRCRRLHLLHGTTSKMPDGTTIARLVLHYASGQQAELPINYGEHVRDWWQRSGDPLPEPPLTVAWSGQNRVTRREGAALNVYLSSFENPRPKDPIQTVDFVSANTRCSPFVLGLSTE